MCRVESAACAEGLAGVDACSLPLSEPAIFVAGLPTERTLLLRPAVFLFPIGVATALVGAGVAVRSEEHMSELQSQFHLVCRLLLEKKKNIPYSYVNVNVTC